MIYKWQGLVVWKGSSFFRICQILTGIFHESTKTIRFTIWNFPTRMPWWGQDKPFCGQLLDHTWPWTLCCLPVSTSLCLLWFLPASSQKIIRTLLQNVVTDPLVILITLLAILKTFRDFFHGVWLAWKAKMSLIKVWNS